jgi:hypothetical protein
MHNAAAWKDAGSGPGDDTLPDWHCGTARNETKRKWENRKMGNCIPKEEKEDGG